MQTNKTVKLLIRSFLKGLIFITPIALTVYVSYETIAWLDGLLSVSIPGLGLVLIVVGITVLGYLARSFFLKPFFEILESLLEKIPIFSILFSSIKEILEAFVGDNKKFDRPVIVALDEHQNVMKVGFITQDDLELLGLPGFVSVYLPHSFNFSGNNFIVKKELVTPIDANGTDVMKFVVSGGVSEFEIKKPVD